MPPIDPANRRPVTPPRPKPPEEPKERVHKDVKVHGRVVNGGPMSANAEYHTDKVVGQAGVSGKGPGGIDYSAGVKGPELKVDASASGSVGLHGVDVHLQVDVEGNAASASADGKKTVDFTIAGQKYSATIDLGAKGVVGADGHINLDVHLGTGGVSIKASADGFAGAKASLTGSIELEHDGEELAEGSVTLSASAGAGAKAHANVGLHGGTLSFDVGAEATVGLGLGVDVDGSINLHNVLDAVVDTGEALIKEGVKDGEQLVENGVDEAKHLAEEGVDGVKDLATDVGHDLENLAKEGYDGAKNVIDDVGGELENLAGGALHGLESFGSTVVHDLNPVNWGW